MRIVRADHLASSNVLDASTPATSRHYFAKTAGSDRGLRIDPIRCTLPI